MTAYITGTGYQNPLAANVVSGAANTFGAWTQLSASLGSDYLCYGCFAFDLTAQPAYISMQLGLGGAGSETPVSTFALPPGITNGGLTPALFTVPIGVLLASGQRLSARVATNLATHTISVQPVLVLQTDITDTTATTVATNLDTTVSSRLATSGYTAPSNATIAAIDAKTTNLPTDPAATSDIPTPTDNANGLLSLADAIETGWTLTQALRAILASAAAKLSGAPAGPIIIRNPPDTTDRITATVDANGNRTTITYNV